MTAFVHSLSISVARGTVVLCAVLVTSAHPADAGINVWTSHGPLGSPGAYVWALADDPNAAGTLYAGTGRYYGDGSGVGGVFKSTDGGDSWTAASAGPTSPVYALAIDHTMPSTLYAGGDGGVFRSTDSGVTWTAVNTGLPTPGIRIAALAIDPTAPSTVYAGTLGGGVFVSTDAGDTWRPRNDGLTDTYVVALAIDPITPGTIYAGTAYGDGDGGAFKSSNGGNTWTALDLGTVYVFALAIDSASSDTVYAATTFVGALKTTDGGSTWSDGDYVRFMETVLFALVIDPSAPGTVYAAGDEVLKSQDGGKSWRSFDTGLPPVRVQALAADPTTPGRLYAGTLGGGVFSIQQVSECTGDCDGDGSVAVAELVTGVRIALDDRPLDTCPSFDPGDDGRVSIDDLLAALNDTLDGCTTEGTD